MRKFVFIWLASILFFSCSSVQEFLGIKEADSSKSGTLEVEDKDGVFFVKIKDSEDKPIEKKNIFIGRSIDFDLDFVILLPNSKTIKQKTLTERSFYTVSSFYSIPIPDNIENVDSLVFTSTNCRILKAKVVSREDGIYILIQEIDESSISPAVKKVLDDMKREEETAFKRGKELYSEMILPLKNPNIPIYVYYRNVETTSRGTGVEIAFRNISEKTIKAVDFEVVPLDDKGRVQRSFTDNLSATTVHFSGLVKPNRTNDSGGSGWVIGSKWNEIWYNPTIDDFSFNQIKVTFDDDTVVNIPPAQCYLVCKNEIKEHILSETPEKISIVYKIGSDDLLLCYYAKDIDSSGFASEIANQIREIHYATSPSDKKETAFSSYSTLNGNDCFFASINGDTLKETINTQYLKIWKKPSFNQTVPQVNISLLEYGENRDSSSEENKNSESSFDWELTFEENDLQFLRDISCIKFYIENRGKERFKSFF